jgi:hypothetical protein
MGSLVFRNRDDTDAEPTLIAWEQITPTAEDDQFPYEDTVGYTRPVYDALSQSSFWPLASGSIIYFSDLYAYKSSTRHWTRIGGTGGNVGDPGSDGSDATDINGDPLSPWPPNRHTYEQFAVDTTRNEALLFNGALQGTDVFDTWKLTFNATVGNAAWSQLLTGSGNVPTIRFSGSLVYIASLDLFVAVGANGGSFTEVWVYAPGTGDPSAGQIAAGAETKGVWYEVYDTGTQVPMLDDNGTTASVVYASTTDKVYLVNHKPFSLYAYTVATQTWSSALSLAGTTPTESGSFSGTERLIDYIPSGGLAGHIYYRQTSHSSATTPYGDWLIHPATLTMRALSSTGTGPRQHVTNIVFDPTLGNDGGVVSWSRDGGLWHGVFT